MKTFPHLLAFALAIFTAARVDAAEALARHELTVDGVVREALVYVPPGAKTAATPVVFAFHGHGGTMTTAANHFAYHTLWPQALVVYPQGLPTVSKLVDPEGTRSGWQTFPGQIGDRDLKFFDAMLAELRQAYKVDDKRIYVTGHSNGGGMTYLLWATRGEQIAAVAPCAAAALRLRDQLKPKPVLQVAGEKDPLVKFESQKSTVDVLLKLNQCGEGQPWERAGMLYPSKIGAPVVTYFHPNGHELPPDAPALITKFFQQQGKL